MSKPVTWFVAPASRGWTLMCNFVTLHSWAELPVDLTEQAEMIYNAHYVKTHTRKHTGTGWPNDD